MLVDMLIHNLSSLASFLGIVASQVLSREQTVGFDDGTPAMHPLWLDGIEPGAFGRQKAGQNAYSFTRLSDLLVVLTNPGTYLLAHPAWEALSQRSLLAVLPWACSRVQHHSRNWVVRALTGRSVTNGGFTLDKRERRK